MDRNRCDSYGIPRRPPARCLPRRRLAERGAARAAEPLDVIEETAR
ncbi:MAG TPA: hypothetical protein VMV92_43145 [Streptosporangiaceae bacterium]|nr:hypothetical protein [Streptosporangiaceae bacterium]